MRGRTCGSFVRNGRRWIHTDGRSGSVFVNAPALLTPGMARLVSYASRSSSRHRAAGYSCDESRAAGRSEEDFFDADRSTMNLRGAGYMCITIHCRSSLKARWGMVTGLNVWRITNGRLQRPSPTVWTSRELASATSSSAIWRRHLLGIRRQTSYPGELHEVRRNCFVRMRSLL